MNNLNDLSLHFLQDVYYAERHILKGLAKLSKAASDASLKQAFDAHREETQHQITRLEQVFELMGKRAKAIPCEAIKGLLEEAEEVIEETEAGPVRDAGLVACAQAVEHYEMARYGALIAWAKVAGMTEIVTLLQATLDEEKKADTLLNGLADKDLNKRAAAPAHKAAA